MYIFFFIFKTLINRIQIHLLFRKPGVDPTKTPGSGFTTLVYPLNRVKTGDSCMILKTRMMASCPSAPPPPRTQQWNTKFLASPSAHTPPRPQGPIRKTIEIMEIYLRSAAGPANDCLHIHDSSLVIILQGTRPQGVLEVLSYSRNLNFLWRGVESIPPFKEFSQPTPGIFRGV